MLTLHYLPQFAAIAAIVTLATAMACSAFTAGEDNNQQVQLPTPDRSQIQVIDPEPPHGLTDPAAVRAYQQGYSHMREATWFAAIAAYDEAIRIQPDVAGLYEARGEPPTCTPASTTTHWRRRAHAHTIAPTPQPQKGAEDATRAIELDPDHHMGYGHRAIARTQLPTPDWQNALVDINQAH